jgi:GH15 family glucan-1,4-alpha-glucosidase
MAAAATTSLPEAIPGTRNWDYRFCWLRDSGFVLRALVDTGFWQEGRAFFDWLMHSTRITQPRLQPLYTLFGRNDIGERTLPSLGGFRGCAPVRDGNGAARQFQLDVYGTVIGAARDFIDRGHRVGAEERRLLLRFGEIICASWREPDDGIWEFRHAARHYTYSKVMAWAGLNDLIWLADHYGFVIPRQRFERDRAALRARIMTEGLDDGGKRFKGALDLDYADASLLLLPRAGFIAPDHPLMIATWDHLRAELERDGMFQRYPLGLDRLEGSEGCFVVCSFWAAGYLAQAGRLDEAARYFEAALGRANDLGLMSEEVDPASNALLGNIPQAFSHAGLINAALALEGRPVNPEREKAAA